MTESGFLAPPTRFERVAFRLGGERSILLSYGGRYKIVARDILNQYRYCVKGNECAGIIQILI